MTLTVELTLEQIADAIRYLSPEERITLFHLIAAPSATEKNVAIDSISQVAEQKEAYAVARAELDRELAAAAQALLPDYVNDKELAAFAALDGEDFIRDSLGFFARTFEKDF
ncbi:MAG: hypothetical protein B6D41_05455 [Chloroflexi bacterium UTCFX4]|jgi:hypothetical protein|nr:MAG: hypothetical protein B6D41_05455 [Chloroflexi bacterium UTCFX4]